MGDLQNYPGLKFNSTMRLLFLKLDRSGVVIGEGKIQ